MFAFVLSGGGNYGAMQAGALRVLLEAGIIPQMLVGTSAGSLNALYLATDLTVEGAHKLENLWFQAKPTEMGLPGLFAAVSNIALGKESLFSNKRLLSYLKQNLQVDVKTFGELRKEHGVAVFTTAVEIPSGKLRVFGDSPQDSIIDGAMASTALPPYYPPWEVGKHRYIDGGALAKLPLAVSVKRGADEILALDVRDITSGERDITSGEGEGMLDTITMAISVMTQQQTDYQLRWAKALGVRVYYLPLKPEKMRFWDFSQARRLIETGQREAEKFLSQPGLHIPTGPTWKYRIRRMLTGQNI